MAIEVIGPPAAGKTTFLRALSPAMVAINEPLYELNAAGFLPPSGLGRQKAVIDHALAQSAQAGERAVIDSGVICLLAFSQLRFRLDPDGQGSRLDKEPLQQRSSSRRSMHGQDCLDVLGRK